MWKKTDSIDEPQPERPAPKPSDQIRERAAIGPSISIKGDLSGEEDLMVHGQVEGKIELRQYNVTVGQEGRVKADIYAKIISVEGEVEGNLFGEEKIIIRKSGRVKGNLVAPRMSLEEGSRFRGSIDMDSGDKKGQHQAAISRPAESRTESETEKKDAVKAPPQKVNIGLSSSSAPPRGQ